MARRRNSSRHRRRGSFSFLYKVLSVLLICGAILGAMTFLFRINTIEITGVSHSTQDEILAASGIKQGDNLYLINKYDVADDIFARLPYVQTVQIHRRLPDTMTLFLAGRGSGLVEAMSLPVKSSLWKLLTMFRNPRVRSMNFYFSAEKKLEIPVGLSVAEDALPSLPRAAAEPAAIAVRPEELMPEFLLRFRREFPAEAAQLFPGVYANDYYAPFTPYGRQLLVQALQDAFGAQEPGRPFPALAACLHQMNELIQEGIQN